MRQLPAKDLKGIFKSTKVVGLILGIGGTVFLGGVCTKPATNMNIAINSNAGINSSISNSNEDANASEIDTSDWLTYTNEEYGFSFRYPSGWLFEENGKYVNFFNPKRAKEATTDPTSSADLYLSVEIDSNGQPISEFYKDKSEFTVVMNDQNKVVVRFEEINDYVGSMALHYYLQDVSQKKVISLTFFKENKLKEIIKKIIDTIIFNS